METTKQVLSRRWYVPDATFGAGATVYAGEDPNTAPLVCDCSAIADQDLWEGDPAVLAQHIATLHNAWLKVFVDMRRSLEETYDGD